MTTSIRVEPLTEARFGGALAIHNDFLGSRKRACCLCSYAWCPTDAGTFAAPFRRSPERLATCAVAVRGDEEVVGFVQMTAHGMPQDFVSRMLHAPGPGECHIEMLAVSAEARGQGVGTKLLEWCEAVARERGARVLSLGVVAGNPARRLYERFGFVEQDQGTCERICASSMLCCLLGLPHCQCGGVNMEKPLEGGTWSR